jgi:hypothetical protein
MHLRLVRQTLFQCDQRRPSGKLHVQFDERGVETRLNRANSSTDAHRATLRLYFLSHQNAAPNIERSQSEPFLKSEPPVERRPVDVTTNRMTPRDTMIAAPPPTIVRMSGGIR